MQIHKLIIFLILNTQQLIKSTEKPKVNKEPQPICEIDNKYTPFKNWIDTDGKYIAGKYNDPFVFGVTDEILKDEIYTIKINDADITKLEGTKEYKIDLKNNKSVQIYNDGSQVEHELSCATIIFKVNDGKNDKYIYAINPSDEHEADKSKHIGIFENSENQENRWESIEIVKIYNPEKLTQLNNLCKNNKYIKTFDFGNTELKVTDIIGGFSGSGIKTVKNLDKVLTNTTQNAQNLFANSEIEKCNLDNITIPKNSSGMFRESQLKNISLNNTNMKNVENLTSFCDSTKIKQIDFSELQLDKPIKYTDFFISNCYELEYVKLGNILKGDISTNDSGRVPLHQKIDLTKTDLLDKRCLLSSNIIDSNREIILPDDKNLAAKWLKEIQRAQRHNKFPGNIYMIHPDISYKGIGLKNFNMLDDINKFLDNPKEYSTNEKQKALTYKNNLEEETGIDYGDYEDYLKYKNKRNNNSCCRNCCCCCK